MKDLISNGRCSVRQKLLRDRYLQPNEKTAEDMYDRVSKFIAGNELGYRTRLYQAMCDGIWLPNTPTLVNAGVPGAGGLSACYVLPIEDSLDGIYRTVWHAARVHKYFGGTGFNFSGLRERGAPIKSTGGKACGPIKVMELLNESAGVVSQGGKREGANMGILNAVHKDVKEFVHCKDSGSKLSHFNISVGLTDKDMVDSSDLVADIAKQAWRTGDPGVIFLDRLNEGNEHMEFGKIECTNPCLHGDTLIQTVNGEIPIKYLIGQSVDVYCMDCRTYELKIARATNICQTKIATEVVHIVTTWGELVCTPEHQVYTRNRGYINAKDLRLDDKLAGLQRFARNERHVNVMLTGQDRDKAMAEHRFVFGYYHDISGKLVHHINGDPHDNRVSNLTSMVQCKHSMLHNMGHECYCKKDSITGRFVPCTDPIKKSNKVSTHKPGVNLRILQISLVAVNEPVYDLTVGGFHNCIANGIVVHNCGEQPLRPYESCNLGSINVSKFWKNDDFDMGGFRDTIWLSVRALNDIMDLNVFPIQEIERATYKTRKIGSGIMGWADLLILMGYHYGSKEAISLIHSIGKVYMETALGASEVMGSEFGNYTGGSRRNETLLTIAPTGTLSYLAGCSWGIEPVFDWKLHRTSESGGQEMAHPLYEIAHQNGLLDDVAHKISVEWQIQQMATWQQYVDNAVSKTINLPSTATVDDIEQAIYMAWELKCKGITVYRDGSKDKQVITSSKADVKPSKKIDSHNVERFGSTLDYTSGCGRIHITTNNSDKEYQHPYEVYILSDGGCPANNEAIGKIISKYLHDPRLNGDERTTVERLVRTLSKVDCPTAMRNPKAQGKSCSDIIAKRMKAVWLPNTEIKPQVGGQVVKRISQVEFVEEDNICPQCGATLSFGKGCRSGTCVTCGWSGCS